MSYRHGRQRVSFPAVSISMSYVGNVKRHSGSQSEFADKVVGYPVRWPEEVSVVMQGQIP